MNRVENIVRALVITTITIMFFFVMMTSLSGSKSVTEETHEMTKGAKTAAELVVEGQNVDNMAHQVTKMNTVKESKVEESKVEERKVKYVYFDVPLDDQLQEYMQDLCVQYDFPAYDVVVALIEHESSFRQGVISSTDDYGLMQINRCNHEWLKEELGVRSITDPEDNVRCGIYMLQRLYHKYDNIEMALIAYNRGEGGAARLFREGIYTTDYSAEILDGSTRLERRTS